MRPSIVFRTIEEPDLPECWLHWNIRVPGYVGQVELETDQYILRPIEHVFSEACALARVNGVPDSGDIVSAEAIDMFGSIKFKFRFWGVPHR